jgi:hypothetical protein
MHQPPQQSFPLSHRLLARIELALNSSEAAQLVERHEAERNTANRGTGHAIGPLIAIFRRP